MNGCGWTGSAYARDRWEMHALSFVYYRRQFCRPAACIRMFLRPGASPAPPSDTSFLSCITRKARVPFDSRLLLTAPSNYFHTGPACYSIGDLRLLQIIVTSEHTTNHHQYGPAGGIMLSLPGDRARRLSVDPQHIQHCYKFVYACRPDIQPGHDRK